MSPGFLDGSALSHAHPVLDLGEGLLDGVEIGGIGRQVPEPGAPGTDGAADLDGFVAAQIVHHHDVAGPDGVEQLLVYPGPEALAINRAVEDAGRDDPIMAQGRHEGHGAPMAMGRVAAQPPALYTPAADRGHVGLDPGFVDEHQALGVEMGLDGLPASAPPGDGGMGLLKREQDFF